ncbi:MAG: hypothetical protein AB7L09_02305 [Nitrospira sp.]
MPNGPRLPLEQLLPALAGLLPPHQSPFPKSLRIGKYFVYRDYVEIITVVREGRRLFTAMPDNDQPGAYRVVTIYDAYPFIKILEFIGELERALVLDRLSQL